MGRKLVFFLIFVLCLSVTLQKKGKKRKKAARNCTDCVAQPRVFRGDPAVTTKLYPAANGTQLPAVSPDLPGLWLHSNATVGFLSSTLSTRAIPATYVLAVAVGVPANMAILCALATKVRKVSSAILYCSLAVSDLLLLLSLVFKAHYHFHGNHWVLGEAACRAVTACFYGNLYCSAQTLACISVKRYVAVVHPFKYKSLPKRMYTAWVSVAVWGLFAAAAVPQLLVRQSYWLPEVSRTSCHDVLPLSHGPHFLLLFYDLFLTALGLLLPLVITAVCYVRIVCALGRSHHDWDAYIRASSLVFVIFLVCFAPAGVLNCLHQVQLFAGGSDSLYVHFKVAACLCCLHACLDPFLFLLMSRSAGSRLRFHNVAIKNLSISI